MHIEHLAIWTTDLERLKSFYTNYFHAKTSTKYLNTKTEFESYFLSFPTGSRLEIMQMPSIPQSSDDPNVQYLGYIHMAFSVGSKENVDELTNRLRVEGYRVISESRMTGDGYYESCVLDPDGNRIEITI